jgi:NAD(P)H-dependent flavin oxidoreductase YrpB (nitropropane dioxygenase family)
MHSPFLAALGAELPVLAAPMAGGYRTPAALAEQIAAVRAESAGQGRDAGFGVNLFAPNPVPVDPDAFREYARRLAPEGKEYGIDLEVADIVEDDDRWREKIELLLAEPVPVVSFTFGIPEASVVAALRTAGTLVVQTVTSPAEALPAAARAGAAAAMVGTVLLRADEAGRPVRGLRRERPGADPPVGGHRLPPRHRGAGRRDPAAARLPPVR